MSLAAEDRPPPRCKEGVSSDKGNNHVWWSPPGPSTTAARSLLHYQIDLLNNPVIDDVVVMSVVLDEVKNKNIPCKTEQQDWGYGDGIPEDWGSSGGGIRKRSGCGGGGGHGGEKRSSMSA